MPEPVQRGQRYMPGLDGLRAIAVLGVVAYHLGFSWIPGGLLGVGVFFTLSGYLITDILLNQFNKGGLRLKAFWLARARRLLPALFVMLIVVMAWVTLIGPHQDSNFRDSAISAAFYVNNWWLIFHKVSYFAAFAAPQPLNHLWSLSIEEQFYIFWPFLLAIGATLVHERKDVSGVRPRLAMVAVGFAIASAILMTVLYHPSIDPSRVYYGTDTRAQELLIGAALAMVWPSRRLGGRITLGARNLLDGIGVLGLFVVALMYWQTQEFTPFLYRGGFLVLSIGTVLAIAALVHPAARLGPIIGNRPMRWVGVRSYGIYLWHFPIIVLTTPEGAHGVNLTRDFFQVAAILIVSALSWRYIENPIRHGALGRLIKQVRAGRWRRENLPRRDLAWMTGAGVVFGIALAGLAGVGVTSNSNAVGNVNVAQTITPKQKKKLIRDSHRTICDGVVHIGDSTSQGLVSSDYLPNPKDLISAQYARVGATTQHLDVSGARSIYETYEGLPNAQTAAQTWKDQGFHGCWVLALGTNEAANVAAGSNFTYDDRIKSMMDTIGDDPVMWVNVRTTLTSGPYAELNMLNWDRALKQACNDYPNMRIYDWADDVNDDWYISDGTHFTSDGYAARGRLIADALLDAFPASHPVVQTDSNDCVIGPLEPYQRKKDPPASVTYPTDVKHNNDVSGRS